MIPLIVGTVLALGTLAYVLFPLFSAEGEGPVAISRNEPMSAGDSPVDVLREIEFDRETGKLSDSDYEALKAEYTALALTEMRRGSPTRDSLTPVSAQALSEHATADISDEAEDIVRRIALRAEARACVNCGPRPEPDAIYCSECGRYLDGACNSCGAVSMESGARFCADCGEALAA